jgi:hypothetical protein
MQTVLASALLTAKQSVQQLEKQLALVSETMSAALWEQPSAKPWELALATTWVLGLAPVSVQRSARKLVSVWGQACILLRYIACRM